MGSPIQGPSGPDPLEPVERLVDESDLAALAELAEAGGRAAELVDVALAGALGDWIDILWQAGWQPADVAHIVRRTRPGVATRMIADCMAARLACHDYSAVDGRFRAQLSALDADPEGGEMAGFVASWARRAEAPPATVIGAALDVIATLAAQNRLDPLCPAPGAARPQATSPDHEPAGIRIGLRAPYEAEKALLLEGVAGAHHCTSTWSRETGLVTVQGLPADLRAVESVYASLLRQAMQAMREVPRQPAAGGTRGVRRAFLRTFAVQASDRLSAMARQGEEPVAVG